MTMQERLKIFVLKPGEGWVVDVIGDDYESLTDLQVVDSPADADIIWLLGSWCWDRIPAEHLEKKVVVCTVHHIVPEKFDVLAFRMRDRFVDAYFVYTHETAEIIRANSYKPIARVAHWIDPLRWKPTDKLSARARLGIDETSKIIGSFQRDTEGRDLISPKMEKGPDVFCDLVERASKTQDITVLLGGWRREYVKGRLERAGIKYIYKELPPQSVIRDMYASCDLYLCTSRREGGPLCILEAAVMKVPIFSTRVGIASDVLHTSQIMDPALWTLSLPSEEAIQFSYERALQRGPRGLVLSYDDLMRKIHEITHK